VPQHVVDGTKRVHIKKRRRGCCGLIAVFKRFVELFDERHAIWQTCQHVVVGQKLDAAFFFDF
jgi:hypothetical protein